MKAALGLQPTTGVHMDIQGLLRLEALRRHAYRAPSSLWTREVTGFDPDKDRKKRDPYCPVRSVSADYPPTVLIRGTEDTDVQYELPAAMDKELTRHQVTHELITVRAPVAVCGR